jgi:hypothetical protein
MTSKNRGHYSHASRPMSAELITLCEQHVCEGEARVLRQKELLRRLEGRGHAEAARQARELLGVLTESLELARLHLDMEKRLLDRPVVGSACWPAIGTVT